MKKKYISLFFTSVAMFMTNATLLTSCSLIKKKDKVKEYVIQYADDTGVHTLNVTDGMPYYLDVIPMKIGYEFLGLFDDGGEQLIDSKGSSLTTYTRNENLVLFPQFKAKEYTVILDYQGAPINGSRQFTVSYDSSMPELPNNLTKDYKEFVGWYTEPNCGGTQIADQYGLIPLVSVVNEQNFDIEKSSITLYAGFKVENFTVKLYFEKGMETEEIEVPYNTPISQLLPKTRVDGKAVLTWSKTQNGSAWNGEVTSDLVLYAIEYAPVIEFDTNGGNEIKPIVARAGETIVLPIPTKEFSVFSHWEDMKGNKYSEITMPIDGIKLKAVWRAKDIVL